MQPVGDEVCTVRVCVPPALQALQAEYVQEVQVVTGGVQDWLRTGVPEQVVGVVAVTVRVCVPLELQAPQAE